ncbi:hypothetical protein Tco_0133054 [Tanacetum coccineum]
MKHVVAIIHTTSDHNDIEWFRKREALQAMKVKSFKASKTESSSALRSKTPTKSTLHSFLNLFVQDKANPKDSHLIAVKRFRYLIGTPSIGRVVSKMFRLFLSKKDTQTCLLPGCKHGQRKALSADAEDVDACCDVMHNLLRLKEVLRIMPPRRFKKKSVKRIVEKRVAKAIEEYEKTRTDSNNAGGSGSANTGGTVAQPMHGGIVFEICKCAEDDKVKFAMCTFRGSCSDLDGCKSFVTLTLKGDDIEAYNNRFHELVLMCPELVSTEKKKIEKYIRRIIHRHKGNVTSSNPATLHDAINMARELIEQGVQAKALRIGDSNKRKWEDQQGNNYHQQQNRRQEAAKVYVAAPAKGRGYAGKLYHGAIGQGHHQFMVRSS